MRKGAVTGQMWWLRGQAAMVAQVRAHLARMARFGLVGGSGVLVNMGLLYLLVGVLRVERHLAFVLATEAAILSNFALNDCWTFADAATSLSWLQRAARYNTIALGGLVISLGVFAGLTRVGMHFMVANLFAIGAATVWNYVANARLTWRVRLAA